jgi:hypothetical protein
MLTLTTSFSAQRYLMREEADISAEDRDQLASIRDELAKLRVLTEHRTEGGSGPTARSSGGVMREGASSTRQASSASQANEAIQRLVQERAALLQSGVYGASVFPRAGPGVDT